MTPTLKRIEPYKSFRGPGGWRRADPETQTFPQEEATDTARAFWFPVKGKNVQITVVWKGAVKDPLKLLSCPADLTSTQERKDGGWQDLYVDELVPDAAAPSQSPEPNRA